MSVCVSVFCERGADLSPRTAEIMARSMRCTVAVSVRELSRVVRVACALRAVGTLASVTHVKQASVASAIARARRARAAGPRCDMADSLRRCEPDQVLRVSLSLHPTWAGTPVTGEI